MGGLLRVLTKMRVFLQKCSVSSNNGYNSTNRPEDGWNSNFNKFWIGSEKLYNIFLVDF